MTAYNGRDLFRYLGSWPSVVGLLLFWFGAAGFFAGCVIGLQAGIPDLGIPSWMLVLGFVWCVIAIGLGFSLRRTETASLKAIADAVWLMPAVIAMLGFKLVGVLDGATHF